jgi:hypothetical protein
VREVGDDLSEENLDARAAPGESDPEMLEDPKQQTALKKAISTV